MKPLVAVKNQILVESTIQPFDNFRIEHIQCCDRRGKASVHETQVKIVRASDEVLSRNNLKSRLSTPGKQIFGHDS
jgi:hypothetical protein